MKDSHCDITAGVSWVGLGWGATIMQCCPCNRGAQNWTEDAANKALGFHVTSPPIEGIYMASCTQTEGQLILWAGITEVTFEVNVAGYVGVATQNRRVKHGSSETTWSVGRAILRSVSNQWPSLVRMRVWGVGSGRIAWSRGLGHRAFLLAVVRRGNAS